MQIVVAWSVQVKIVLSPVVRAQHVLTRQSNSKSFYQMEGKKQRIVPGQIHLVVIILTEWSNLVERHVGNAWSRLLIIITMTTITTVIDFEKGMKRR
jgi:hypothetical protein